MVFQAIDIYDELAELLASMDPQKVMHFRASEEAQKRIDTLLDKNKHTQLSPEEAQEMERFMIVEHIVRLAKARARRRLSVAA